MQYDELIGKTLGDFRIEARIGRGGMARVYRAYQASVNRQVAVKVIAADLIDEDDLRVFRERFEREAKVIASLEHANILPVYAYGVVDNITYIAMRLLDGGSLSNRLSDGPLDFDQAREIFRQIARGLAYAHSKGVVHRDLKPGNILFSGTGEAFLTDFGLAKWVENSPALTQTGKIVGTPAYMSPEQLRGTAIDQRADIYSMGVILYQMLTGELPFDTRSGDVITIIYKHLEEAPPPPHTKNPRLSAQTEAVVLRALEKDPAKRFASILEMADSLDLSLGRLTTSRDNSSGRMSELRRRMMPRQRRNLRVLMAATIIGLLILLAVGALYNQFTPSLPPHPTVEAGIEGPPEDIVPNAGEIALAQRALGASGFIAYVTCNQTSEYHATQAREMGDMAANYGLAYRVYDSDTDDYEQLTQIERARTDGAKALILCPLNADLLRVSLTSVQAAHMPLVLLSNDIPSYGGVLVVGDEYQMGYAPGKLAGEIITNEMGGHADVVILDYPDLPPIVRRADGLVDGLLAMAPEANIIGRYRGATPELGEEFDP